MTGLPVVYICQKCGLAVADSGDVQRTWLIGRHRRIGGLLVIRCPQHITEWSLRQTVSGRTKEQRARAAAGKEIKITRGAYLAPIPIHFLGANRTGWTQGSDEQDDDN